MVKMLAYAVGGDMCVWDSEVLGANPRSATWNNSFIIGIYPAANRQG